jgi:hypothetical protein
MKKNYHAELDAYSELFLKTELCKTCIKTSQQLPDHYSVRIDTQSKEIFYLDNNNKHVQIWSEKSGILPIKDLLLEKFFRQHINENSDKLIPEEATLNIMPTVDAQPKEYRLTLVWNDGKKECTEQLETKISQEEIDDLMIQF